MGLSIEAELVAAGTLAKYGGAEEDTEVISTLVEESRWKVGDTDLQVVSTAEWLDKHACDDGQESGGCCGGWAVYGGRGVWVGNNDEYSRFGRIVVAVWVGGVEETFAICS